MYHDFVRNRSLFIAWGRGGGEWVVCRTGGGLCVGEYLISPKDSVIFLCSLLYNPPVLLATTDPPSVPP